MVVFYVKNKVSKARDGYEVAGLLKEKIGNEEGFFEFGLLKVEPYSKYLYNLHNRCYFFRLFQAIEGKREASEEHQTRATGEGVIFFWASSVARVWRSSLASRLPSFAGETWKNNACYAD